MVEKEDRIIRYIKMPLTQRFLGNLAVVNKYGVRQFPMTKTEIGLSGVPRTPEDVADTIITALDSIYTFGPYEVDAVNVAIDAAKQFKQQEKRNAQYSALKKQIFDMLRGK